jgi:hypothetical protein
MRKVGVPFLAQPFLPQAHWWRDEALLPPKPITRRPIGPSISRWAPQSAPVPLCPWCGWLAYGLDVLCV